jgi:hypothetical protein
MGDKIHKWIITAAALCVVLWVLSQGILFVYNLTAAVNFLGTRVTNLERLHLAQQQPAARSAVRPTQ